MVQCCDFIIIYSLFGLFQLYFFAVCLIIRHGVTNLFRQWMKFTEQVIRLSHTPNCAGFCTFILPKLALYPRSCVIELTIRDTCTLFVLREEAL